MHALALRLRATGCVKHCNWFAAVPQTANTSILPSARWISAMSRLPRHFVPSKPRPAAHSPGLPVTVVTYNLLAQKYIDAGCVLIISVSVSRFFTPHDWMLVVRRAHNYCPAEHRSWQSRWPRIAAELKDYDADILCLQEVTCASYNKQVHDML